MRGTNERELWDVRLVSAVLSMLALVLLLVGGCGPCPERKKIEKIKPVPKLPVVMKVESKGWFDNWHYVHWAVLRDTETERRYLVTAACGQHRVTPLHSPEEKR